MDQINNKFSFKDQTKVLLAVLCLVGLYAIFVLPKMLRFQKEIFSLEPTEVLSMTLENQFDRDKTAPGAIDLSPEEIKQFLILLKEAKFYAPNHPRGGWTFFARIKTLKRTYFLPIHSTSNNGTFVDFNSNFTDGWNYGNFRNDALKIYIEDIVDRHQGNGSKF